MDKRTNRNTNGKYYCLMDVDPGVDDAAAMLLAFASDKLDIRGITVSAGNSGIKYTVDNALNITALAEAALSDAGFSFTRPEIARGAARPLVRELITAPQVHGEKGLGGVLLKEAGFSETNISAPEFLKRKIEAAGGEAVIIATAPLTNLALLLIQYPEIAGEIKFISLMGGSISEGNSGPGRLSEFNFYTDPEAARIVLNSGIPIYMSGLNLTHKAILLPEDISAISKLGSLPALKLSEMLKFYMVYYMKEGFPGTPIHDACAVMFISNPELFETVPMKIEIECRGDFTRGVCAAFDPEKTGKNANVHVVTRVDRAGFAKAILKIMEKYTKTGSRISRPRLI